MPGGIVRRGEHRGMDVGLAAHRRRVAEIRSGNGDRRLHGRRRRVARAKQRIGDDHARGPGAEVLRRVVVAHDRAQVCIDVAGRDATAAPVLDVLEQALPRQVLAAPDRAREARILEQALVALPGLAAERDAHTVAAHVRMMVAQGAHAE